MRALWSFIKDVCDIIGIPYPGKPKCLECHDSGWASYTDRIGAKTYHVYDHCRACRERSTPPRTEGERR